MTLVGCFVTPHPAIIVPEVGQEHISEVRSTVDAMLEVGEHAAALAPETIVLLSPHASIAGYRMGISPARAYKGSLAYFRAPHVRLECEGDQVLAQAIQDEATQHGVPAVATTSPAEVVDLDWGALVPLLYLTGAMQKPCALVLLSFSGLSIEEHVRFGELAGRAMCEASKRVLYVASGDLSHRLMPGAPAGFDPKGAEFDNEIVESFAAGDWDRLLGIRSSLVAAAGECGYRSLAVLSGVVAAAEAGGAATSNRVLSYEGPFGVGYLVGEVEVSQTSQG